MTEPRSSTEEFQEDIYGLVGMDPMEDPEFEFDDEDDYAEDAKPVDAGSADSPEEG